VIVLLNYYIFIFFLSIGSHEKCCIILNQNNYSHIKTCKNNSIVIYKKINWTNRTFYCLFPLPAKKSNNNELTSYILFLEANCSILQL
jgi:hypothetical protein